MAEIYISFADSDFAPARQIKDEIDNYLGINCWMDSTGSRLGQLPGNVTDAIDRAGVFVFMLSGSSLYDQRTLDEMAYAHFKGKRIVVIGLEGATVPDDFIDRFGYRSPIDYAIDLQRTKFLRNLRAWLGVTTASLTPPPRGTRSMSAPPTSSPATRPAAPTAASGTTAANPSVSRTGIGSKFGADALAKAMAKLKGTSTTATSTTAASASRTTRPAQPAPSATARPAEDDEDLSRYSAAELYDIGYKYYNGEGGRRRDYALAVRYYTAAARMGHASAACNLGLCYDLGKGVPVDKQEAIVLYRQAANGGSANAACNLGFMYETGDGVPKDYAEAVRWYRKGAEKGLARAQCNLAYMYDSGMGVRQDYREALSWYRKAADQGHARAQCNIGWCYDTGHGVSKDPKTANLWYQKAAAGGNLQAMHNLGYNHEHGIGVQADLETAVTWYRKAASQGHANAKKALQRLGRA